MWLEGQVGRESDPQRLLVRGVQGDRKWGEAVTVDQKIPSHEGQMGFGWATTNSG